MYGYAFQSSLWEEELTFFGAKKEETLDVWQIGSYGSDGACSMTLAPIGTSIWFAGNSDSTTMLDYADQRFYASTYGRFNTPDPYGGSAHLSNPVSWNRYSYTRGDPINNNDPRGLCVVNGQDYADGGPACPDVTSTTVDGGSVDDVPTYYYGYDQGNYNPSGQVVLTTKPRHSATTITRLWRAGQQLSRTAVRPDSSWELMVAC